MPFDAADLAVFYDDDMPGYALVSPSNKPSFGALMRSVDRDVFDTGRVGTHVIRYVGTVPLLHGDTLIITANLQSGTFVVQGAPKRLNSAEFSVDLVKQ